LFFNFYHPINAVTTTTAAATDSTSGGILDPPTTANPLPPKIFEGSEETPDFKSKTISETASNERSAAINLLIKEVNYFIFIFKSDVHFVATFNNLLFFTFPKEINKLEKSIDVAANEMKELNHTLNSIIQYRKRLDDIETALVKKVLEDGKLLRDVEDHIKYMEIIEKELDTQEAMLLALNGRETLLGNKIEHDLDFYNDPSVLDSRDISFFAQRTGTFNVKTVIHPYDIVPLNQGQCFSPLSGVFTVPFHDIYHFYFTGI
jgi:hypothetical protein